MTFFFGQEQTNHLIVNLDNEHNQNTLTWVVVCCFSFPCLYSLLGRPYTWLDQIEFKSKLKSY